MPRLPLRSVEGSVMVAVPAAYLERTGLGPSAAVEWSVEGDQLILRPAGLSAGPHYALDEILAECDPSAEVSGEDAEWTRDGPVGREPI